MGEQLRQPQEQALGLRAGLRRAQADLAGRPSNHRQLTFENEQLKSYAEKGRASPQDAVAGHAASPPLLAGQALPGQ